MNIYNLIDRANLLQEETTIDSISPSRIGSLIKEILLYINEYQLLASSPEIQKIYFTVSAMQSDGKPVSDLTGRSLNPGQLVVIVPESQTDATAGDVYRYDGPSGNTSAWTFVAKIGAVPADSELNASSTNPVQNKVVTEKLTELSEEINGINDVYLNLSIPQRATSGGENFALAKALQSNVAYDLAIKCSDDTKQYNFRFLKSDDPSDATIATINGVVYEGYISNLPNGTYTIIVQDAASYIRVTDNAQTSVKMSIEIHSKGLSDEIKDVSNAIVKLENSVVQVSDNLDKGEHTICAEINIPKRETYGGNNISLQDTLNANVDYILRVKCSDDTKQYNFRFLKSDDPSDATIATINGVVYEGYISNLPNGEYLVKLNDDASYIRVTDNTQTSINITIERRYGGLQHQAYELYSLVNNGLQSPLLDIAYSNQGNAIDDYINSIPEYRLCSLLNGYKFEDALNFGKIGALQDYFTQHDSQCVIVNNMCYVVYAANTEELTDNASSATNRVILSKFPLNDFSQRVHKEVAGNGIWGMNGGAGQPNIIVDANNSDILHILFTGYKDGYSVFACDYHISTGVCDNYHELSLTNRDGVVGTARNESLNMLFGKTFPDEYISQQCNSTIAYSNGKYYIGLVAAVIYSTDLAKSLAVVFTTTDFVNLRYFADFEQFQTLFSCELAMGIDGNGRIYGAVRPRLGSTEFNAKYGIIAKWKDDGTLEDSKLYRNCSSRPSFFNHNNKLYLFSNTWYRSICDIIEINEEELNASQLIAQFHFDAFHYTSFSPYNGSIVATSSTDGIGVYRFSWINEEETSSARGKLRHLFVE